ncbi:hypothetical protein [Mycobacterium sp. OTB74]|jgi:hypothetical protein|uniref:hypothetical protein n=1 Tax=Mycobacterium sp. OTB74 TaxID=1853452 RepID=UPI00247391A9|nr:hypothetical protein [Mycobacterium sp. OTB74]MDH6247241.1 hypothetical protein [Mycobacterium sp. OTB74]
MPDIRTTGLTIYWHPNKQAFDFAALIYNAGLPLTGWPINVTLGATFVSEYIGELPSGIDYQFTTAQVPVTVPANVTLNTGETYRTAYFAGIPFLPIPGENYNYVHFQVILADLDGVTLNTYEVPPAPPVPLTPEGYEVDQKIPVADWWKLQPAHIPGIRPPEGPVLGRPTTNHP